MQRSVESLIITLLSALVYTTTASALISGLCHKSDRKLIHPEDVIVDSYIEANMAFPQSDPFTAMVMAATFMTESITAKDLITPATRGQIIEIRLSMEKAHKACGVKYFSVNNGSWAEPVSEIYDKRIGDVFAFSNEQALRMLALIVAELHPTQMSRPALDLVQKMREQDFLSLKLSDDEMLILAEDLDRIFSLDSNQPIANAFLEAGGIIRSFSREQSLVQGSGLLRDFKAAVSRSRTMIVSEYRRGSYDDIAQEVASRRRHIGAQAKMVNEYIGEFLPTRAVGSEPANQIVRLAALFLYEFGDSSADYRNWKASATQ